MPNITYEQNLLNKLAPFIFHADSIRLRKHVYLHWHESIEFLCCYDGEGEVLIDSVPLTMKRGDTVIINSQCIHSVSSEKNVSYFCLIVNNEFFTENGIDIQHIRFSEIFSDKKASFLMNKISVAFKGKNNCLCIAERRSLILSYVIYVCKKHSHLRDNEPAIISNRYAAIRHAVQYINTSFSQKFTVDEIAAKAGYSKYHFSRLFKEITGFTVIEYINATRCEHASHLLRKTKKPISDICYECGFEHISYFSKTFMKFYSELPSVYRKNHCKPQ